jgi:predicted lipid-binding transport protein (Tim44 family)
MSGGFPIDLVLFGMVAVFLVLRLMSILGKRTGFERQDDPPGTQGANPPRPSGTVVPGPGYRPPAAEAPPSAARKLPDPASPLGLVLQSLTHIDGQFTSARFLAGAEAAFRLIVLGFAKGERITLHPLLSQETYAAFEGAITAREAAGQQQQTDIRAVNEASIEQAELAGTTATITVRFVSDQVNVTLGADGHPVAGTDAVTEIVDLWSFERDLATSDPAWRLVAARSA